MASRETTLFDLIQNGYGIVAVTSVAARSTGLPEDTYILQKNNSVFRCVETRATETGTTRASSPLRCAARNSSSPTPNDGRDAQLSSVLTGGRSC